MASCRFPSLRKFEQQFEEILLMNPKNQELVIKELLGGYRQEYDDPEKEVTCDICYNDYKQKEMCKLPHCGHVFCWEDHFKEKLQSVDPNGLGYPCLEGDCSTQLSLVDLLNLNYVTKAQYTTVLKFVSNNIIDTDNHVVQCPNNKCLYRYYETKTGCQPTKCPKCNKEFCIECKQNWHPNLTCKEAEAKRKNDNESEKFIYQTTRPCPYCGVPIFKDEGCRYMKCSKCSGFFCWICMEKTGNHVHKNGVRWGDCKEWKLGTPYPQ